jgi:hypothetical protein
LPSPAIDANKAEIRRIGRHRSGTLEAPPLWCLPAAKLRCLPGPQPEPIHPR